MNADQHASVAVRSLAQIRRDALERARDALERLAAVVDELRGDLATEKAEQHRLRERVREALRRVVEIDGEIEAWFDPAHRQREAVERARGAAREPSSSRETGDPH